MTPIIYVPIEPIPSRYSESWYRNIPAAFRKAGHDVRIVDGVGATGDINVGSFVDMNETVIYKMSQLSEIARMFKAGEVQPGATFFFGDIEFWGLESVRLMADMNRVPVKITGFLHAASYTKEDAFSIAARYQCYTEVGWIASLDAVFVGSEYHKRAVYERRLSPIGDIKLQDRIHVTGNPLFSGDYVFHISRDYPCVVLPNRFDTEKGIDVTLDAAEILHDHMPNVRIIVTTSARKLKSNNPALIKRARDLEAKRVLQILEGLSKEQYHAVLAHSTVMWTASREENYGYCIAESLLAGCVPLMTPGLSHDEFADGLPGKREDYIFTDVQDLISKTTSYLNGQKHAGDMSKSKLLTRSRSAMNSMIQIIENL